MSNSGPDVYTDSMKQLLSFMMSTPCINTSRVSASSPRNAEDETSRSAAPNPPLAPMHDLTSTIANLNVYESQGNAGANAFQLQQPNSPLERRTPKPQPISLQRRDMHLVRATTSAEDFSVSPSVLALPGHCLKRKNEDMGISPRLSPHERFLPERKRSRYTRSPMIESVELFAVLVNICDASGAPTNAQVTNRGNN
jgi:hypothetical protein